MGLARAYLKVQCNPVICRVVRKIHSPLTPIRVLSPPMQLIGPWCYLGNAEQFNTLTRLLLCKRTHAYHSKNSTPTPLRPLSYVYASCIKKYSTRVVKEENKNKSRGKKYLGNAAKSDTSREMCQGWQGNLEYKMENFVFKNICAL